MSLESHVSMLRAKHRDIEQRIDALCKYYHHDSPQVKELKKAKLRLKDEIARCERQLQMVA